MAFNTVVKLQKSLLQDGYTKSLHRSKKLLDKLMKKKYQGLFNVSSASKIGLVKSTLEWLLEVGKPYCGRIMKCTPLSHQVLKILTIDYCQQQEIGLSEPTGPD